MKILSKDYKKLEQTLKEIKKNMTCCHKTNVGKEFVTYYLSYFMWYPKMA